MIQKTASQHFVPIPLRKGVNHMIEFFLNVIIVSGGVACILAWIAFVVEVYDRVTGKNNEDPFNVIDLTNGDR